MNFKTYLKQVGAALKEGNATEHTHRPALKTLVESLAPNLIATNEPKRIECGAPDFIVTQKSVPLGYIEAKDVNADLDKVEADEQLKRYRTGLRNFVLTDYLEFRLYRNGEPVMSARIASWQKSGTLKATASGAEDLQKLLSAFVQDRIETISKPRELAARMAHIARIIRVLISNAFARESARGELHTQYDAFRKVLLGDDLTPDAFADMYAQTICYGLFAARCNHVGAGFSREGAGKELPRTNPFLRKLFQSIAGADLDERISWAVDDLVELLARADMDAILKDFGGKAGREDPVVHFYETFLAAYDPKLRETRGVYYTPEPVVNYIVRSVDSVLKKDFSLSAGLADRSKIKVKKPAKLNKKGETVYERYEMHKVQILDPATGTGTFIYSLVQLIWETFATNKGLWDGYVAEHLLPRVYGFELLMAPYAVAHMKLGLQLRDTGYEFRSDERLRVYLTNTLERAHELSGMPLFTQWLAEEARMAGDVKQEAPIMVVMGNPPYSGHSANAGPWISELLRGKDTITGKKTASYFEVDGNPLNERQPKWLNDDYVKFIRFAQWRIEETGYGVLAFITNNGYLDNPTFRGMRQSLMTTFDDIYLLNLHGSSKKKERAPDGSKDENVFDIQQGVSIGIFVKKEARRGGQSRVSHADLYGERGSKYEWLWDHDVTNTQWQRLDPQSPSYLFVPRDTSLLNEYNGGWRLTDAMPTNNVGILTARDELTIRWNPDVMWETVHDFAAMPTEEARERYDLGKDAQDWQVAKAQKDLVSSGLRRDLVRPILYRPFDVRYTYYTGKSRGFHARPAGDAMRHMVAGENVALATTRSIEISAGWQHAFVTNLLFTHHSVSVKEVNYLFPLYVYASEAGDLLGEHASRRANLASGFVNEFATKLGLRFVEGAATDRQETFGPEDVLHYTYALLFSPGYRARYSQFLKSDYPRIPTTANIDMFRELCGLGERLASLHLMTSYAEGLFRYPVAGANRVEKVEFNAEVGRVYVNSKQYFDNVSKRVWEYQIGGYQVAEKWLKDRKNQQLAFEDLQHYLRVLSAIEETMQLQDQIDSAIATWPIT